MALPRLRIGHPLPGMVRRVNGIGEEELAFPRPERFPINDLAGVVLPTGSWDVAFIALTSARTVTLPLSSTLEAGTVITVLDEAGAAGSHTITIAAQGADLINGGSTTTITSNYGVARLKTNANGGWFLV